MMPDPESGSKKSKTPSAWSLIWRVFLQAFTLTFLAEWGDRSQLTTIILGARESVMGVILGGILGHVLCTGLAVLGGRMIAQKISVRTGNYFCIISLFKNARNYSYHMSFDRSLSDSYQFSVAVTIIGGIVFLIFAFSALFFDPNAA